MKSIFVILTAIISLHGTSGYSSHEYQSYVAKNVNGFATVEGIVSKDGVVSRFYKVIPDYSNDDSIPSGTNAFPDPIKIPDVKIPEFVHFQEPQIPVQNWNGFSINDQASKLTQDIFEQNKKIQDSINSNFLNTFSNQPGLESISSQPVFGNGFSSQPVFRNTFSSQPLFRNGFSPSVFGNTFSSQPNYNTFSSQPFANTFTQPGFRNSFSAQPNFGNSFFPYDNAGTFILPEYPQFNYWL